MTEDTQARLWGAFILLCFAVPLGAVVVGGFSGRWGI